MRAGMFFSISEGLRSGLIWVVSLENRNTGEETGLVDKYRGKYWYRNRTCITKNHR